VQATQTPETTTEIGLGFLKQIKETRDKRYVQLQSFYSKIKAKDFTYSLPPSNRLIATHFLKLPDKVWHFPHAVAYTVLKHVQQKVIPEYYQQVGLPMALDMIEVSCARSTIL